MLLKSLILVAIAVVTAVITATVDVSREVIFAIFMLGGLATYLGVFIDNKKDGNKNLASYLVIVGGVGAWLSVVTYAIVTRIIQ